MARRNRVHPDIIEAPLGGQPAGNRDDGPLRRGEGAPAGDGMALMDRCKADDCAAAVHHELCKGVMAEPVNASHVDVEHPKKVGFKKAR